MRPPPGIEHRLWEAKGSLLYVIGFMIGGVIAVPGSAHGYLLAALGGLTGGVFALMTLITFRFYRRVYFREERRTDADWRRACHVVGLTISVTWAALQLSGDAFGVWDVDPIDLLPTLAGLVFGLWPLWELER